MLHPLTAAALLALLLPPTVRASSLALLPPAAPQTPLYDTRWRAPTDVSRSGSADRVPPKPPPPADPLPNPGPPTANPGLTPGPSGSGPLAGGAPGRAPGIPGSKPGPGGEDLHRWQTWWAFHREDLLEIDRRILAEYPGPSDQNATPDTTSTGPRAVDSALLRERALPLLRDILGKERDANLLTATALALGKLAGGPLRSEAEHIAADLRPLLAKPNPSVAESSAIALGLTGAASAATWLGDLAEANERGAKLAGGSPPSTRLSAFACYGLGLLAERTTNPDVRRFVAQRLLQVHERESDAKRELRVAAVVALAHVPLPSAIDGAGLPASSSQALFAWLRARAEAQTENSAVATFTATTLARVARSTDPATRAAALESLIALVAESERSAGGRTGSDLLEQGAALGLGSLAEAKDGAAIDALMRVSARGSGLGRRFALIALGQAAARSDGSEAAEENARRIRALLIDGALNAANHVQPWMALALGVSGAETWARGNPNVPEVDACLLDGARRHADGEDSGAWALAVGLARVREPDAANAELLMFAGNPRAPQFLVDRARTDGPPFVRGPAAIALALTGNGGHVAMLATVTRSARNHPSLMLDGIVALGLLGAREATDVPLDLLASDAGLDARFAASRGLAIAGDGSAVDRLVALAKDASLTSRDRALLVDALGGVGSGARRTWSATLAATVNYSAAPPTLFDPAGSGGLLNLQ